MRILAAAWLVLFVIPACAAAAQEPVVEPAPPAAAEPVPEEKKPEKKLNSGALAALAFRSIGPALMSGRIADIAIHPERPNTWFVAAGSGGVWKTENAGTTWRPIFDGQASYSIGCVTLDPRAPETLWVGTGEAVGGRHVGFGDGVHRSRDGGGSFENLGLKSSEHIAKIVVDPRHSAVVWVAAQGPLWSPGGERGLYKTSDGGVTWLCVLAAGPYTGATDVLLDPRDPDIVYAALHQRHRTVWALINGGPESAIHKSEDGGATWRKLGGGLPDEDLGKIGLAMSPQDPDVLYATIELAGRSGGFWRSANGGATWEKKSDYASGGTGPHYYQELWADPHRFDAVYQANVTLGRTDDGGADWDGVGNDVKHVDNHAVAFHPQDPDFLLVGCDGGLYLSHDRGKTFHYFANLPLTQFYKVDVDYDWPEWHVVGGTQDNATQYGPARTLNGNGIRNSDWRVLIGGDGHDCAIEPANPDLIYCESQEGYIQRFDRRAGVAVDVRPQPGPGEGNFRFNWDSPILISPHAPARVWFASNRLFRSDDRGESWTAVSPDLTRAENRLTLDVMGRTWSVDALWDLDAMSQYASVTAISESPVTAGLIYAGTDDGLIQVTEDGGRTWRQAAEPPGLTGRMFLNDVEADRFDADTVYAAGDRHKEGDFTPYLFRSADRGRTWTSITGDLPARHLVWRVIQDHVEPRILFAGTEFGVWCTLDGGAAWLELSGGLPTIPVRDLEIQRRENALVAATFGRGFYVLDDYSPLRALSEERFAGEEFFLCEAPSALRFVEGDLLGGRHGAQGDGHFSADNPPYGATLTYWLRDEWKTREAERKEAEKKAAGAGEGVPFPGWEALAAEEREEDPALIFEVRTPQGEIVKRFTGATGAGLHRATWDLRWAGLEGADGPPAVPGEYLVQAYRRSGGVSAPHGAPVTVEVVGWGDGALPAAAPEATLAFQQGLTGLQREIAALLAEFDDALARVSATGNRVREGRAADLALADAATRLGDALRDARDRVTGNRVKTRRGHEGEPSIQGRLGSALYGTFGHAHGPTLTHRRQFEIARDEFAALQPGLRALLDDEVAAFRARAEAAGLIWVTAGR